MRGRYIGLVVLLLLAFVMLPGPSIAAGNFVDCPVGSPAGATCYQGTDTLDSGWTATAMAYQSVCGQDKKGNDILCTKFDYAVTGYPEGVYANQADVKIGVCETGDFYIVSPTDKSIKIRDCDPNSGLFCNSDVNSRAITFDSLKNLPNLPTTFNVSVSPATIEVTTLGLVTELGNILIPTLGPDCCSETQVRTEIENVIGFGGATYPTLNVTYDICSSTPTSVSYSTNGQTLYATKLEYGLAHCFQDSRTGNIDTRSCSKITKLGPESGLYVLADKVDACILGDGTGGTSTECPGYGYYGWGNKIYQFELDVPYPGDSECTADIKPVPRQGSVVIDDIVQIVYDGCGNGTIYDWKTGEEVAGPNVPSTIVYLVPYDQTGKLDLSQNGVFVSASEEGVAFYNVRCYGSGLFMKCYP